MVTKEKVEKIMSKTLLKQSEKLKIPLKDIRINMRLDDESDFKIAYCVAYNQKEPVSALGWHEVAGGGTTGMMMAGLIANGVTQRLIKLSEQEKIQKDYINIMVYPTNSNAKPELRLLDAEKIVKKIELTEIL
jgi:hypothetical protein